MWSSSRPGVATRMSTPRAMRLDLRPMADAAEDDGHREVHDGGRRCGSCRRSGWQARAWGSAPGRGSPCAAPGGGPGARRCRIGSAKAAVLPVPVWAMPSRSLPSISARDGLGLDGRGCGVAFGFERLQEARVEAEFKKCRHCVWNLSLWCAYARADVRRAHGTTAQSVSDGRPAWPGQSVWKFVRGAQQGDEKGSDEPETCPFTRLERRKPLI